LARAIQGQSAPRPNVVCAIFHNVSPLRTLIFSAVLETEERVGMLICAPAAIRCGFSIPGFTASSSRHREPLPKFCCASFQSESPRCTVTEWRIGLDGCDIGTDGREGAISAGAVMEMAGRWRGGRRNGSLRFEGR